MAWSLPWKLQLGLICCAALASIPNTIWIGALTPVSSFSTVNQTLPLRVSHTAGLFSGNPDFSTYIPGAAQWGQWLTPQGLFSNDPSALRCSVLSSASRASFGATDKLHLKLDNTGFEFVNRSLGVGRAVGLVVPEGPQNPMWMSYYEPGYVSEATCRYNYSVAFRLDGHLLPANLSTYGDFGNHLFVTDGSLPNGELATHALIGVAPRVSLRGIHSEKTWRYTCQQEPRQTIRATPGASLSLTGFSVKSNSKQDISLCSPTTDTTIHVTAGEEYTFQPNCTRPSCRLAAALLPGGYCHSFRGGPFPQPERGHSAKLDEQPIQSNRTRGSPRLYRLDGGQFFRHCNVRRAPRVKSHHAHRSPRGAPGRRLWQPAIRVCGRGPEPGPLHGFRL
jgi:hypothetical protein